jgi:glucosamine-6-phosphate deaminase
MSDSGILNEQAITRPTVLVCADAEAVSLQAAELFAAEIRAKPDIVLGLATGGTPVGMYDQLVRMHREEGLDFSEVRTFNLDEYLGLAPADPQSYRAFMQKHLFDHINILPANTHVPDGLATDTTKQTAQYEAMIESVGGIDLQLLGIGHNGHIAFNEPGSAPDSRTRVIGLAEKTIEFNARFFESIDDVPRRAITVGIGTILGSRRIVMLATGADKADAVRRAIDDEPDVDCPASLLQRHANVTFILDRAAAGESSSSRRIPGA